MASQAQEPAAPYNWMEAEPTAFIREGALEIPVVDFSGLNPLFNQDDGKIRVINFWATWCAPCIKELPYFEEVAEKYRAKGVEVTLVSLDIPSMWEERLPSFIIKKGLRSPVVVLDDPDQNSWIPRVDENWTGAIPATLIYAGDKRRFFETALEREILSAAIEAFIN
jgi:thiol-disulfide isomerase/thioredoxin